MSEFYPNSIPSRHLLVVLLPKFRGRTHIEVQIKPLRPDRLFIRERALLTRVEPPIFIILVGCRVKFIQNFSTVSLILILMLQVATVYV